MVLSNKILKFLKDLKKNNNREWFMDHKQEYEIVKTEFEDFTRQLIEEVSNFDSAIGFLEPKKCIFRIYRDVRFSTNKAPYKSNFGAYLSMGDKINGSKAGYYIQIEPGGSFIGGGAYLPQAPWLKHIRNEIDYRGEELKKIINSRSFKKYFKGIEGEQLATVPKGFSKEHPHLDLLRYKSFTATQMIDDAKLLSADFLKHCGKVFYEIKPLNDFLNAFDKSSTFDESSTFDKSSG